MRKKLILIGGGFAVFWSAMCAVRQNRELKKNRNWKSPGLIRIIKTFRQ